MDRDFILRIRAVPHLVLWLKIFDLTASLTVAAVYVSAIALCALEDVFSALRMLVVTGIPFAAVSLLRRLIDAPRPCELYRIEEKTAFHRGGASFPSRHAFSAFAIGTQMAFVYPIAAAAVLILGVIISISRVLLGRHFLRDVAAGALAGILGSVIGMLIIF